ncbi:hypothetical protein F5Y09DRAFT_63530 [Xylaria sp. FL1042]|nr:hypothetical protein F5Y09DRAFT_63530 [Xylaria sp. FL1042]
MIQLDSSKQASVRRACDRCHRSKLKCSREIDEEKCQRCLRANVECIFSPPASTRRQKWSIATLATSETRYRGREPASIAEGDGDVSRAALASQNGSGTHANTRENPLGEPTSHVKQTEPGRTLWLRRIADVNMALTENLDSFSEEDVPGDFVVRNQKEGVKSTFMVDQAFHLSQIFIDILGNICSQLPAPDEGGDRVANTPRRAAFELDPSAELLIFSAYLRLLETYHRVLEYIQTAAKQNHFERSTTATPQLPSLVVGSFSLPSKTNTQSLVLVNLTETMAMKARELITKMSSPKITPGYRGDFQSFGGVSLVIVPDLALRAIHAREDALTRIINHLKSSVL